MKTIHKTKNEKVIELESIIANFEIEELEERLEFREAFRESAAGWDYGSGCTSGMVCYNF